MNNVSALNEFNACYWKRAEARYASTCFSMFVVPAMNSFMAIYGVEGNQDNSAK